MQVATTAAWRIVKRQHAAASFDGEGARLFGGRWNSPGTSLVYTSGSLALAALETLVHLNPPVPLRFVAIRIEFEGSLVESISTTPRNWRTEPPPRSTQAIGDRWVRSGHSAILRVPSVLVPGEFNFLLNPGHPDFRRITIGKPKPFGFDPRLL